MDTSLTLSPQTYDPRYTIWVGRSLQPGNYRIRWRPRDLAFGRDTGSAFFAMKGLRLDGQVVQD